jgi:hypothetical protein
MSKPTKRPSKAARAARKILSDSKLLTEKSDREGQSGAEYKASVVTPRTSKAIKPRPDKKRG